MDIESEPSEENDMKIRAHSLEAAAAAMSLTCGCVLLVETAKATDGAFYTTMGALDDEVVAELKHRDAAIVAYPRASTAKSVRDEIQKAFDDDADTDLATRITTFMDGRSTGVLTLGPDLFEDFDDGLHEPLSIDAMATVLGIPNAPFTSGGVKVRTPFG